jgi:hypothetical protein
MTFQMFAHRVMEREKTAAGTHAGNVERHVRLRSDSTVRI